MSRPKPRRSRPDRRQAGGPGAGPHGPWPSGYPAVLKVKIKLDTRRQSGRIFGGCIFEVWPAPGGRLDLKNANKKPGQTIFRYPVKVKIKIVIKITTPDPAKNPGF